MNEQTNEQMNDEKLAALRRLADAGGSITLSSQGMLAVLDFIEAIKARAVEAERERDNWESRLHSLKSDYEDETTGRHVAERALDEALAALAPFAKIVPSSLYKADGSEGEKYIVLLHDQMTGNPFEFTGVDLARARALVSSQPNKCAQDASDKPAALEG